MLFSTLFGKSLMTMLAPDPDYEDWVTSEGIDGNTDFHIADSPFMYTNGWDFVGVSQNILTLCLKQWKPQLILLKQSLYLPDGVSVGGYPFHGAPPGAGGGAGGAGGAKDTNMFGEPI